MDNTPSSTHETPLGIVYHRQCPGLVSVVPQQVARMVAGVVVLGLVARIVVLRLVPRMPRQEVPELGFPSCDAAAMLLPFFGGRCP